MCGNSYLHFLLCGLEHTFPGDWFEDLSKNWKHLGWLEDQAVASAQTSQQICHLSRKFQQLAQGEKDPLACDPEYIKHSNRHRSCILF